jgi:hypothetical protein
MVLHPAQAPTGNCERCPSETPRPAASRTLRPPARVDDAMKPSSPRRSSQSRPGAAPAPIAVRRRIVPFAPFNPCRCSLTARQPHASRSKTCASPSKNRPEYLSKSKPLLGEILPIHAPGTGLVRNRVHLGCFPTGHLTPGLNYLVNKPAANQASTVFDEPCCSYCEQGKPFASKV